jgi:hypothetical protein
MQTFNRSQITKSAWNIFKTSNVSFSQAMKMAWAEAKNPQTKIMTKAQKIAQKEIEKGLEIIERYGAKKPELVAKNKVQERIAFVQSMSAEQIEKYEHFLEGAISGQLSNYERLISYVA